MSQIKITNLTFGYDGSYHNIFENVSFQIDTDWKLGFIGRNGRGKTTFLHLLLGKYPYQGKITHSVTFDYFPFAVRDASADTQDVIAEVYPDYVQWELSRELSLLEVEESVLHRPFKTLSKGEQTKVLLAALFLKENHFLLMDEPTNHLDAHGRKLVSQYLNRKKGFILISHDRSFLDGCVDHILSINKTNIEVVQGHFSSWLSSKECQDSLEFAKNESLKKEIKRLKKAAEEKAAWSNKAEKAKYGTRNSGLRPDRGYLGHKAAKTMKRSKVLEVRQQSVIAEKSQLLKNVESAEPLKIDQRPYHASPLVSLNNVSIFYGAHIVCQNISFILETGDRVALCGKNGSGKSSVLKLICRENIPYCGNLHIGSGLNLSYVSQDTSFLKGNLSDFVGKHEMDESLFKAILRKLDFSREQFDQDMADFSEGQKKKLLIAKSLCDKAHLYVWDEPLNYMDVISRIQIEALLLKFKPTILFVEHDRAFCENIATKMVYL
ncbi:MAG: ABC-F type ribosomal protection protein [Intestinimonas sp.]|jgi:lincosamide and streptogramin A transport system ATP-binding/permease protein|nr:ABC-F type ribosomal protection protein [Intestinimonas sp.]